MSLPSSSKAMPKINRWCRYEGFCSFSYQIRIRHIFVALSLSRISCLSFISSSSSAFCMILYSALMMNIVECRLAFFCFQYYMNARNLTKRSLYEIIRSFPMFSSS